MNTILFALWFFLPAGAANAAPIIASKLPFLSRWNAPIDGGIQFRGERLFGTHKTWRGLISGIIIAIAVVYLQRYLAEHYDLGFIPPEVSGYLFESPLLLGFLFGFGALAGDALKSFFKRQFSITPGSSWFPFDQLDYVLGGCIAAAVVVRLPLPYYLAILAVWFFMHLAFSYLGYRLNLKSKPI